MYLSAIQMSRGCPRRIQIGLPGNRSGHACSMPFAGKHLRAGCNGQNLRAVVCGHTCCFALLFNRSSHIVLQRRTERNGAGSWVSLRTSQLKSRRLRQKSKRQKQQAKLHLPGLMPAPAQQQSMHRTSARCLWTRRSNTQMTTPSLRPAGRRFSGEASL